MTAVNPKDLSSLLARDIEKEEQELKGRKQKKGPHKLEISGSITNQGACFNICKSNCSLY